MGATKQTPLSDITFPDPKEAAPELLQEAEQKIIRHEKCNEIFKKKMGTRFDVVREGCVCGFNDLGKDSCQVSPCPVLPLPWGCPLGSSQAVGPAYPASPSIGGSAGHAAGSLPGWPDPDPDFQ